jgi:hypothetical protein
MRWLKLDKEDSLREMRLHPASILDSYILKMAAHFHPVQVDFADMIIADKNFSYLWPSGLAQGLGLDYSIVSHIDVYYLFHVYEC